MAGSVPTHRPAFGLFDRSTSSGPDTPTLGRVSLLAVDAGGVQTASGKAEEESDTSVVSATTTTRPVVVWASPAPPGNRETCPRLPAVRAVLVIHVVLAIF